LISRELDFFPKPILKKETFSKRKKIKKCIIKFLYLKKTERMEGISYSTTPVAMTDPGQPTPSKKVSQP
jgi:hypothetical protein